MLLWGSFLLRGWGKDSLSGFVMMSPWESSQGILMLEVTSAHMEPQLRILHVNITSLDVKCPLLLFDFDENWKGIYGKVYRIPQ
jgi:hypothetical protein